MNTKPTQYSSRIATLEYFARQCKDRTAQLKKHSIYLDNTNPGSLKRQSEVTSLKQGNAVKTFKTKLNSTDWAFTDLQYDTYGNVTQVKGAQNHKGQRGFVNYSYDNVDHQYIENITNHFGESICNQYDHSTGLLERTLGINDYAMQYEYDQFQRLVNIWAPRELLKLNSAPTVHYSYDLENRVAVTTHNTDNLNHYDVSLSGDNNYCQVVDLSTRDTIANGVKTATFIDGLGKAVQIKTTKTNAATTATSVVVSGIVQNNRFGKPVVVRADFIDDPNAGLRTLQHCPLIPCKRILYMTTLIVKYQPRVGLLQPIVGAQLATGLNRLRNSSGTITILPPLVRYTQNKESALLPIANRSNF